MNQQTRAELEAARERFLAAVNGAFGDQPPTSEEMNWRPAPDQPSIRSLIRQALATENMTTTLITRANEGDYQPVIYHQADLDAARAESEISAAASLRDIMMEAAERTVATLEQLEPADLDRQFVSWGDDGGEMLLTPAERYMAVVTEYDRLAGQIIKALAKKRGASKD
jgi:DinB superfamily